MDPAREPSCLVFDLTPRHFQHPSLFRLAPAQTVRASEEMRVLRLSMLENDDHPSLTTRAAVSRVGSDCRLVASDLANIIVTVPILVSLWAQ
jgi:hypothetical protein